MAESAPGALPDRSATLAEILRSCVFYVVFYGGTAVYAISGAVMLAVAPSRLERLVADWSRFHRACASALLGIRVAVSGVRPTGAVLVALKHQSFFEAIDLPTLLDRPVIFAKAELLRLPFWGRVARVYGLVGVERETGAKALRTMISEARRRTAGDAISAPRVLAIFPEGTRVPCGDAPPLQSGFAGVYKLLGLPVVPTSVDSGTLYHRRWKRAGVVHFAFGDRIDASLPRAEIEARVHAAINAAFLPPR